MSQTEDPNGRGAEPADVARLRAAFASAGDGQHPVDTERVFDALHGDLPAEERRAVVDELLSNEDAAEAWRLARDMEPETVAMPAAPARSWRWLAAAAAAVMAIGIGWQIVGPTRQASEPVYRGTDTQAITSELPAGAPLSRRTPVLRWTPIPGARYRVRVLTPELVVLEASAESDRPEYRLSDATVRRVAPGGEILWQIDARVPGGGVISSPTFRVLLE